MAKITGGKIMNLIVRGSVFGGWVALMNERGHVSHMINLPGLPAPSHPAAVRRQTTRAIKGGPQQLQKSSLSESCLRFRASVAAPGISSGARFPTVTRLDDLRSPT